MRESLVTRLDEMLREEPDLLFIATEDVRDKQIARSIVARFTRQARHCTSGCVALDGRRSIETGPDLSPEDLTTGGWPLARSPYLLETNRPGVFAVGDVRGGNIKRVAFAWSE